MGLSPTNNTDVIIPFHLQAVDLTEKDRKRILRLARSELCRQRKGRTPSQERERRLVAYLTHLIGGYTEEHAVALYLDMERKLYPLRPGGRTDIIAAGSQNFVAIDPIIIADGADFSGAAYVVLAHNHPSGNPTPSPQDIDTTRNVFFACLSRGIKVLDHIIVGKGSYCSFTHLGLIPMPS